MPLFVVNKGLFISTVAAVAAGGGGICAGAGELFMSRRCSLGRKSIKFSLFAVAEALVHQTTADAGPAGGLAPNGPRKLPASWTKASVAGPEITQLLAQVVSLQLFFFLFKGRYEDASSNFPTKTQVQSSRVFLVGGFM